MQQKNRDIIYNLLISIVATTLIIFSVAWGFKQLGKLGNPFGRGGTTYCIEKKKVVKIQPIYEDNGKHEDENYRVEYDDGSIEATSRGDIKPYTCTKKKKVKTNNPDPSWKVVDRFDVVDWAS